MCKVLDCEVIYKPKQKVKNNNNNKKLTYNK